MLTLVLFAAIPLALIASFARAAYDCHDREWTARRFFGSLCKSAWPLFLLLVAFSASTDHDSGLSKAHFPTWLVWMTALYLGVMIIEALQSIIKELKRWNGDE